MSAPTEFLAQDPTVLTDPSEEFLNGGLSAPDTDPHDPGLDLGRIALVLASAFIVYRVLMRAQMTSTPHSEGEARKLAADAWKKVAPVWVRMTVPAIARAYQLGSTKDISYEEMEKLATDYAQSMGEYVNDTSAESLVEGFNGGLSSGWNETLAWIRASEGFGLDSRQMRAYVSTVKGDGYDPVGTAAKKMVDAGVMTRAQKIGENEAFAATQMGKVIVWMTMQVDGTLPPGTKKKWITANDERVCGVCGPLDQDQVGIHQHFTTVDGQKYYAPGVHPNCRCQMELVYPEVVIKALNVKPERVERWTDGQERKPERVQRVKDEVDASGHMDPLAVNYFPGKGLRLMNGHHRLEAAKQSGRKKVPVRFRLGAYKAWKDPANLNKAMGDDPYDRKPNGEFAPREQRQVKVKLREKTVDPVLEELLHRVAEPRTDLFAEPNAKLFEEPIANLFHEQGRTDLFTGTDVLTSTQALVRVDLYSSKFKNARRTVIHHVMGKGVEGDGGGGGDYGFWNEPVFFSGDDFTANWTNVPILGQPQPTDKRPSYKVGSILSVDSLSHRAPDGTPKIVSLSAWSPEWDNERSEDEPTAAETALLGSLRAGLEYERLAESSRKARSTAAEDRLNQDVDPDTMSPANTLERQTNETLRYIIEGAADREGKVRGSHEWQSLMNSLPSDPEEQKSVLIDFIMAGYKEGDLDLADSISDTADVYAGISEDEIKASLAEAEATIDPEWTPTVIMATGYYGGVRAEAQPVGWGGRLVEGTYEVIETKKGYIGPDRLDYLVKDYLNQDEQEMLRKVPLLSERGEYRIVVVKPKTPPQYPVGFEGAE